MSTTYTAEEIKALTTVNYWPLHSCSLCGVDVGYHIHPECERVAFDSSCDCTRSNGWQERSWQDIADTVNMQTEEVRQRMLSELRGDATRTQQEDQPK